MLEPEAPAITSSLVLAADDPAALAQFYGALLNVEPQPGRLALCLQRKTDATGALAMLHTWIEEALELGASAEDPPRQEPFGAEAWLLDPEGNRLLLLMLP
jgi:hypothetical protein